MVALIVLFSAGSLYIPFFGVKVWGLATLLLGLVSILALAVVVAEGTIGVLFLVIPGVLALIAGYRGFRWKEKPPA